MKKHLALKILVSLLPALLFTQNWAWMTGNKIVLLALLAFWLFFIWHTLKIEDKNRILHKLIRAVEIGFFLLPISALIFIFVIGGQAMQVAGNEAAQAGVAVGMAIGGVFVVGIGFVIGLFGGIICHLIANRYEKKAGNEKESDSGKANFFEKHKMLTLAILVIVLFIIAGSVSSKKQITAPDDQNLGNANTQENVDADNKEQSSEPEQPKEPAPIEIAKTSVSKDIIGSPVANITIKNISEKEIDGIKVRIKTFNNFDEPVNGFLSDNTFNGIAQDKVPSGASHDFSWPMYNFDGTTKITPTVFNVHFTDGSSWSE